MKPESKTDGNSERADYHEFRDGVYQHWASVEESYDRNVLMLSSGAFGLTIALMGAIEPTRIALVPLVFSWCCFGLSIYSILQSHRKTAQACEKAIDEVDRAFTQGEANAWRTVHEPDLRKEILDHSQRATRYLLAAFGLWILFFVLTVMEV